jgi:high-affinity Fe2+/Pb2+ permease
MCHQPYKHGLTARRLCDMDAGYATVLAAAVASFGGIIIAIMQLKGFRDENRADHAVVQKRLDNLIDMVGKQGARLTSHLDWHLTKEPSKDQKVKQVATRKKK